MSAVDDLFPAISSQVATLQTSLGNAVLAAEAAAVTADIDALDAANPPAWATTPAPLTAELGGVRDTSETMPARLSRSLAPPAWKALDAVGILGMPELSAIPSLLSRPAPAVQGVSTRTPSVAEDYSGPSAPGLEFPGRPEVSTIPQPASPASIPAYAAGFGGVRPVQGDYLAALDVAPEGRIKDDARALVIKHAPGYAAVAGKLAARLSGQPYSTSLFSRARARIERTAAAALDRAALDAAARGFAIPPEMLQGIADQAGSDASDAIAAHARAAEVGQWRLDQDFGLMALQAAAAWFAAVLEFAAAAQRANLAIEAQALEAGAAASGALRAQFAAGLALLDADIGLFKAEVGGYGTAVKAALAGTEQDRLVLDRARAGLELDEANIARARRSVALAEEKVGIYRAKVSGAARDVQGRLLSLELYGKSASNALDAVEHFRRAQSLYGDVLKDADARLGAAGKEMEQHAARNEVNAALDQIARARLDVAESINRDLYAEYRTSVRAYAAEGQQNLDAARVDAEAVGLALRRYAAMLEQDAANIEREVKNSGNDLERKMDLYQGSLARFKVGASALIDELRLVCDVRAAHARSYGGALAHAISTLNGLGSQVEQL